MTIQRIEAEPSVFALWTNTGRLWKHPLRMTNDAFTEFAAKMRKGGLSDAAIRAFKHSHDNLIAGQTGLIPESSIQPVTQLPRFEEIQKQSTNGSLLSQAVVVKLNGGLGTSMGL